MEIQKAKELRDKLQEDILKLIQKFEEETETHVYYVNVDSEQMLKNPLPNTVKVEVEFRFLKIVNENRFQISDFLGRF